MEKVKKIILFILLLAVALTFLFYVVASFASIRTVNADSVKVLTYETTEDNIKMKVGIGISSHVLVGYDYQIVDNKILIKIKKAPIWSMFFFKTAQLNIKIPIGTDRSNTVFFTDDNKQIEVKMD